MFAYEKLSVWQAARDVAIKIYRVTEHFPDNEKYGLSSQMNRAAVSIASNIAEGNSRSSKKERVHFIEIAYGSLMELACQFDIARELEFVDLDEWNLLRNSFEDIAQKLSALKKYHLSEEKRTRNEG